MEIFHKRTKIFNKCRISYNKTGKITAGAYLVSITEIGSDCQQTDTGTLLIIN